MENNNNNNLNVKNKFIAISKRLKTLFMDSVKTSVELFKILIPVSIAVKILSELDLIKYLALPIEPIMKLVGLPAEMGLAWAVSMANNMYAGLIVFLSLAPTVELTTAQVTVLGTMILVAHSFPAELGIAKKAGAQLIFQFLWRFTNAIVLGIILNLMFSHFDIMKEPANIVLTQSQPEQGGLLLWIWGEIKKLFSIFMVIFILLTVLDLLKAIGAINIINRIFQPLLNLLGISKEASAITVAGMTLGLAYGGGLIISEAKKGHVSQKDVFYSLSLLGICHSLIEDTLLMVSIGGNIYWLLLARFLFMIVMVAGLVKFTKNKDSNKFLWKS